MKLTPDHSRQLAVQRAMLDNAASAIASERVDVAAAALMAPVEAYPRQLAAARSTAGNLAITGSRRSGKTEFDREVLRRMITQPNYVVHVFVQVLRSYTENWLERDGDGGALALLDEVGVVYRVQRTKDAIRRLLLPNGAVLTVHDAETHRAIARRRGFRGHLFIFEEAQELEHLHKLLTALVGPARADFGAQIVVRGTPGDDVASYFHTITQSAVSAWQQHYLYCWDNPWFGDTPDERWLCYFERTIEPDPMGFGLDAALLAQLRGLTTDQRELIARTPLDELPDDLRALVELLPDDLLAENFGRWVHRSGQYVFPARRMLLRGHDDRLYWAAAADLPTWRSRWTALPRVHRGEWVAVAGYDLGYDPDPFAWWIGASCDLVPGLLEFDSGKEHRLDSYDKLEILQRHVAELRGLGFARVAIVVDHGGGDTGSMAKGWSRHFQGRGDVFFWEAHKPHKLPHIKALSIDMRAGRLRGLRGSACDVEQLHLRYKKRAPGEKVEIDKHREVELSPGRLEMPGDHCCDARRYAWDRAIHRHDEIHPVAPISNDPRVQAMLEQELGGA